MLENNSSFLRLKNLKGKKKYGQYGEIQRTEIAKWGIANDITAAARKFSVQKFTV